MGISKDDLKQMERYYRRGLGIKNEQAIETLLDPNIFENKITGMNKALHDAGFEFQIDGKELLGIIVDLEAVNRLNQKAGQPLVSPVYVAVFRKVSATIRKERNWTEKNEIPKQLLTERIQGLVARAKKKTGKSRI